MKPAPPVTRTLAMEHPCRVTSKGRASSRDAGTGETGSKVCRTDPTPLPRRGREGVGGCYNSPMATDRIRTEPPRGGDAGVTVATDPGILATYEEDAARSRGQASGVARPRSETAVAALLA